MFSNNDNNKSRMFGSILTNKPKNTIEEACIESKSKDEKYHVKQTPIRTSNSIIHTDIPLYSNEILHNLRRSENKKWFPIQTKDYLKNMKDITPPMRLKLIHWLMEVHRNFELTPPSLFLCINLVDRVLSQNRRISPSNLQLIGCCCLWIACKYHEKSLPMADDFIWISDHAFTHPELVEIEGKILNMVDFDLTVPTVYTYIQRYVNIAMSYVSNNEKQKMTRDLMMGCVQYACVSYDLCLEKPSKLAAAVFVYVCFGLCLVSEERYVDDELCEVLGYKVEELLSVVRAVHMVVKRDCKGVSIFDSFKNGYFMDGSKNGCGISGKYGW